MVCVVALCLPAGARASVFAKGVDVSHWNGTVDWIQVATGGYSFLFAKATEGSTIVDPTYPINRAGAEGLGLRFGAYHFARPGGSGDAGIVASAVAQADFFVDTAQPAAGELLPALDLEASGGLSPSSLARWTQAWLDEVEARIGVTGLIYAGPHFWSTALSDTTAFAVAGHKLWLAHWTSSASPNVPAFNWGGLGWAFWQWTDCSHVPGVLHCVDGDRLNGPDPAPFTIAPSAGGVPAVSSPPTVIGTARVGAQLAAVPGVWSGGKPVAFAYQWQSCDAAGGECVPLPGATLETYTPTAADAGHALLLTVTATASAGTAVASAPATVAVAAAGSASSSRPAVIAGPQLTGTLQAGQTLTASVGTWSGSPSSFAYLWRRCDAAGAACTRIAGAAGSSYTVTPGDIGATISLVVTATGKGGSQSATAPTTLPVVAAPVPQASVGSAIVEPGAAGAVATDDGRASVTWQPGAVPNGSTVSLAPAAARLAVPGSGLMLGLLPPITVLPWAVDVGYAAAPAGQVLGYSVDGSDWSPVALLSAPTLPAGLKVGMYTDAGVVHVLTRLSGKFAFFRAGAWGDPTRVSAHAPVLRLVASLRRTRLRDGSIQLGMRLSTSSQSDLYANVFGPHGTRPLILSRGSRLALPLYGGASTSKHTRILFAGSFPVQLRIRGSALVRGAHGTVRITAIDPWGRRTAYAVGFVAP
ncbi:MAG: GH25 family lysozyme [Gaiellaceae bacterium]